VPVPDGEIYINVAPETQVVHLAVGQTTEVHAIAFSDASIHPWRLAALPGLFPSGNAGSYLDVSITDPAADQNGLLVVENGTPVVASVTLLAAPPSGTLYFFFYSQVYPDPPNYPPPGVDQSTLSFAWPVAVATP
jgi:hypothetical protein